MSMITRILLIITCLTGAFTIGTVTHAASAHAAEVTATPAQEAAACRAVYHFHHVNADDYADEALWQAAYRAAWQAARHAGPGMRADIDRWLFTDHGWSLVRSDCDPQAGADHG